jgi:predicted ester cyclase
MDRVEELKSLIKPLRLSMYDFSEKNVKNKLNEVIDRDAKIQLCHPFGDVLGPLEFYEKAFKPLYKSMPDLERRDYIVISGVTEKGYGWVGCCGIYMGTFLYPMLDIPPTGHLAHMRFHEFYRFEGNKVVEIQAIWDLPELMMQANAWPMVPSLGREWCVPGPATMDGLSGKVFDARKNQNSLELVLDMADAMKKHPSEGGPELMELNKFWHPRMNWYGPAGIGTGRGIEGFRNWHQIPFLNAMPDRGKTTQYGKRDGWGEEITYHFFADYDYVAVTGWPNMSQTITHDGWMGIAPSNKKINLRSLDFWRIENGKIRENWVLVDLLHIYHQIGVDVFARLSEFNKARSFIGNKNYTGVENV